MITTFTSYCRGGSSSAPTGGGVTLKGGGVVNGGWVDGLVEVE